MPHKGNMVMRPDPIKWLEALLSINQRSDYTSEQKIVIARALRSAMKELGAEVASVR